MKLAIITTCIGAALAVPGLVARDAKFDQGIPIDKNGKGGPINGAFIFVNTLC